MKKIITLLLILTVAVGSVLSLASCDDDGFTNYFEYGIKYRLPDYFRKRSIQNAEDIIYTTPGARFAIEVMPREEIDGGEIEYEFDFSMSVEDYAKFFIEMNEWNCEYHYDKERNVASFYVFWTPSLDEEYGYYYFNILKSNDAFYVVVMSCAESDYENYEPLFREWATYLEAVDAS